MPANTSPVFGLTPNVGWVVAFTAANTAKDGTGTVQTVFTAGSNGAMFNKVVFRAAGTNVATVARIFLNNGSTNSTAANNALIGEVTLPATTLSETGALSQYEWNWNQPIPAGYKINVVIGTAVSAGYVASGWGMDF